MRFCKSCKFLKTVASRVDGRKVSDNYQADDYYYTCTWSQTIPVPWPENNRTVERGYYKLIGKRHVEPKPDQDDWTEVMDCNTWESK